MGEAELINYKNGVPGKGLPKSKTLHRPKRKKCFLDFELIFFFNDFFDADVKTRTVRLKTEAI